MNTKIDAQTISPEAQCKVRAKRTSHQNVYKAQVECTSDTMTDICQFKFKLNYEIQECIEHQNRQKLRSLDMESRKYAAKRRPHKHATARRPAEKRNNNNKAE